jgi:hypothetical protein
VVAGASAPSVLYLVGPGRSGSTILERILGASGAAVNVGEFHHVFSAGVLKNQRCECGEPFDRCPFWTAVGQAALGGWDAAFAQEMVDVRHRALRQRYLPQMLTRRTARVPVHGDIARYVRVFDRLYTAVAQLTGTPLIVDSSKEAAFAMYLAAAGVTELRALQLVRDPRGVAFSWAKAGIRRPDAGRGNATMRTFSAAEVSRMWNRELFWGMVVGRYVPRATLRYEQFAVAPRPTLAAALAELGLPDELASALDQETVTIPQAHAIGGNPVRFSEGPLRVRLDDAWRREMCARDRQIVTAYTFPMRTMSFVEQLRHR